MAFAQAHVTAITFLCNLYSQSSLLMLPLCSCLQALAIWTNQTEAWDAPMFFGEFGANNDPNPDNEDFQVCLIAHSST